MADHPNAAQPPEPRSLAGHTVPEERRTLIMSHIEALSTTALAINDTLPLEADVSDYIAVIEAEVE